MKIVLLDITLSGHHLTYLRLFADAFRNLGNTVTVVSPASEKDLDIDGDIECVTISKFEKPFGTQPWSIRRYLLDVWSFAAQAIGSLKPSNDTLIFFSYLDFFLECYVHRSEIDTIFPYNWSGLYMNPKNFRSKLSYQALRKGPLEPNHLLTCKRCKALTVLDRKSVKWLQKKTRKPVVALPDITDGSQPDFEFNPLKLLSEKLRHKKKILLIGVLQKRKGVMQLMELIDHELLKDYAIIMAGRLVRESFSREDLQIIEDRESSADDSKFFFLQELPTEAIFNAFISSADIIYACYDGFLHSSNMIGKAALFKKPILVARGGYMAEIVKDFKLGESVHYGNTEELILAIRKSESRQDTYGFEAYNSENSFKELSHRLNSLIMDTFN